MKKIRLLLSLFLFCAVISLFQPLEVEAGTCHGTSCGCSYSSCSGVVCWYISQRQGTFTVPLKSTVRKGEDNMFEKKLSDTEKKRLDKEAKKKNKAEKKNSTRGSKAVTILKTLLIPALFAGIVSLLIYMAMENKAAEAELKGQVVIAKVDVAANTTVKPDEVDKYFEVVTVERTAISDSAYKSIGELPKESFYIESALKKSQMVYKDDLATKDSVLDKYKNGFEVTSFAAESFDGGVNGSLRKGDIVDAYALDPATELLVLMAEDVYVSEVYDSAGNKVTEPEGIATAFTVYVTPEEVENINLAVVYGKIQMYLITE